MSASHGLRLLTAAATAAALAGTGESHDSCVGTGSATCKSSVVDAPLVGNAQLQNSARLQRGPEGNSASLAAISRKSGSQQMQFLSAAVSVENGVERMRATWDSSMDEINNMITGIVDHDSASEDTCSTQLSEYKKKLTTIHESTISISVAVQSTSSEVSIFQKECKEKDEELEEIEQVHQKRVTKCTTERSVEKKTLETLRYDMKEMKHVAKAHIHLKSSKKSRSNLVQEASDPAPRQSLADVRGMVKQTKETASKVQTCLAKAAIVASGGNVSFTAMSPLVDGQPKFRCDGIMPRCFPVMCTHDGWTCGDASSCPATQPRCHPVSCVDGHWKCGTISDPSFEACENMDRGDTCQFTIPNRPGKTVGSCVVHPVAPHLDLMDEDLSEEADHKEKIDDDTDIDDDKDDDDKDNDDKDDNDDNKDGEDGDDDADGVEVFLQEGIESASSTSPLVRDSALKCVPAGTPTECQEVVVELEHQFTTSYVSLTRMIEEYEVVTHSTVCEETVEEEYTEESSGVQDEANKVCSEVQSTMSKLEKFKFEYQSTTKTEHKLESSIKLLVKQCGSLSSTEEYLTTVTTTLNALGDCPGLGEVQFQLPTWTGEWVKFTQRRDKSNEWNDVAMLKQCTNKFGKGTRVAEVSEIDGQSIEGMPDTNTAEFSVLGACPNCKGTSMPGLSKDGRGRICWDAGASFDRKGRRRDCGGGPRSVLCVYDQV